MSIAQLSPSLSLLFYKQHQKSGLIAAFSKLALEVCPSWESPSWCSPSWCSPPCPRISYPTSITGISSKIPQARSMMVMVWQRWQGPVADTSRDGHHRLFVWRDMIRILGCSPVLCPLPVFSPGCWGCRRVQTNRRPLKRGIPWGQIFCEHFWLAWILYLVFLADLLKMSYNLTCYYSLQQRLFTLPKFKR